MFASPCRVPSRRSTGARMRVLDATLDDPEHRMRVRLDAADGPLWLTSVEEL